ncbi:MAG: hypothetical protein ACHBN1_28950 [Heteroscytonema crispum UTEX LB 1556]
MAVPAEGENFFSTDARRALCYDTKQQDGCVYLRLAQKPSEDFQPFKMPFTNNPDGKRYALSTAFTTTSPTVVFP